MEAVVVHRVGFLEYFCPKQGQDFKPSAAPIYPNMGKVPLRGCEAAVCNKYRCCCQSSALVRYRSILSWAVY